MPSADDIRDAAAQAAEDGIARAKGDMGEVEQIDPAKQLDVADRIGRNTAAGKRHRGLRFTRLVPPGAE